jgi:antitoxin VapB
MVFDDDGIVVEALSSGVSTAGSLSVCREFIIRPLSRVRDVSAWRVVLLKVGRSANSATASTDNAGDISYRHRSNGSPSMSTTDKLFRNGRSQAVRLPGAFRFQGDRVRVRHVGRAVLLEPIIENVADWFYEIDRFGAEPFMADGWDDWATSRR